MIWRFACPRGHDRSVTAGRRSTTTGSAATTATCSPTGARTLMSAAGGPSGREATSLGTLSRGTRLRRATPPPLLLREMLVANFTTEKVTRQICRWIVPAAEPWGAAAEEVSKAWGAAEAAYREAHGLAEDASLAGNALQFHVRDDEIVIEFQTEN